MLYLDLYKSNKDKTGETRGGKYVARVQTGVDKDGSPKYRYFTTQDEYNAYLESRGGKKQEQVADKKKQAKDLKDKVDKEHKESTKKQKESSPVKSGEKKRSLLLKDKKTDDEDTKKSILYLGVL